jgi:hypothetical protein
MDLIIAFVLGAGTVLAGKRGTRVVKNGIGWTARRMGYFSKHAAIALAEARRLTRQEFTRGRDRSDPIIVDIDDGPNSDSHESSQNGVVTNGESAPGTGGIP